MKGFFHGEAKFDSQALEQLEEALILSDLGVKTASKLVSNLPSVGGFDELKAALQSEIQSILSDSSAPEIELDGRKPVVVLVVGVNGVGKTTTIGKLATQFEAQGAKVLLGAGDTFRAAAAEQLGMWAERAGVEFIREEENAKPTTLAYNAAQKAKNEGFDVLILDTAGRLHTRKNLMNELESVSNILLRELGETKRETILVVDACTGQNALQQAREFNEKAELTGIVVTKLDGTPKGGIVVAIKDELGVPIRYVGVGEGQYDLRPFSASEFAAALFDEGELSDVQGESPGAKRRRERREGVSP